MRILLAVFQTDARAALRLLLTNSGVQIVEESADWSTTLQLAKAVQPEIVLIDWEIIPTLSGSTLTPLRLLCPTANIIVLVNQLNNRQRTMISVEADVVINKSEMPDQIAQRILAATKQPPN